ncbi:hypothetical protein NJF44_25335 [Pseudomonas guariconensis]|uniref:hypothetical protein n=1 Tax=Pseudomonas TaxID=286 RepID=UPI0020981779|nr:MULTISPECIES: hypothetical protein [Pseudomonas]MCO7643780.1 hypothetical protein [Pseudomonas sp. S 311-6]MCO7518057.1 hypothetical protein [Pseudomonas putida]MCO7568304.1 hypothetical protein [Pseudomonas mosselii]MCO7608555.1 hypothetical protein [Pseudomonas guariconensis]MCO7619991.1 hypothetical protein [Pseudomonas guariconensis]
MKLPPLDLDALHKAALHATNRQLAQYLLDTLGPTLPRLHTRHAHIHALVAQAGNLVCHEGYGSTREYSVLVLTHFLLGLGWWNDLACQPLWPGTQAGGLAQDERLGLLAEQAIAHRQQLETQLPHMHDIILAMLGWREDAKDDDRLWHSITQLMALRGLPSDTHEDCYCQYESDACERYGLRPLQHKELNGNEILAYRHYGKRLPQPSDDLKHLPALPRNQVLLHVLLAIAFGRHFYLNPLFATWVTSLDEQGSARQRCQVLGKQLTAHQRALKDTPSHV